MADDEVTYTRPAGLVALEQQANAKAPDAARVHQPGQQVVDNGGFVGVDPIYQNAANEVDQPYQADGGPDAAGEKAVDDAIQRTQANGGGDVEFDAAPREQVVPEPTPEQSKQYASVSGVPVTDEGKSTDVKADADEAKTEDGDPKSTDGSASEGTEGKTGDAAKGAAKQGRPAGTSEK